MYGTRKDYKSLISRKCRVLKLDVQIQGNMPGYWYTVYMTDDIKPGKAGYQVHSGDSASTWAFLKGWAYCADYAVPVLPEFPSNGRCPECGDADQGDAFGRGDSCDNCGWRPECPVCHTEI